MTTVQLHLGDCLDILPTLAAGSVDAVVTDPPYGLDFGDNGWDGHIPDWLTPARRVAPIVVFTTAPTTLWDYPRPDWLACWYRTAARSRSAQGGFNHWTPIPVYGKAHFTVDSYYTNAMTTAIANKTIEHPTPKDVRMVAWLVENTSVPGGTVLDPFMGSGTTGVACMKLGRNFIGIERDPVYFKIAQRRIAAAQAQLILPLFAQVAP